jgi:uncharacterized protein (TIGR02217 family)
MSLTILTDVRLDNCSIAYNVRGKVKRSNTRAVDGGGYPKVNINWSRSTREYEFGIVPMSIQAWREIESLFEATDGGAYGFLLQDPKDSIVSDTDGLLMPWSGTAAITGSTIGLGYGVPTYRLFRRYVNASRTTDRLITRPMTGLVLRRAASVVTQGASPGNVSVNLDTGTVTFVADQSQAITSVTTGASTVLTFANNTGMVLATSINDRVYITGTSGSASAALNNRSHLVTNKNTDAFTLTLSTATSGSATGGTALRYPQPSQSLTWTGNFWTPVHFASDDLDWEILRSGDEPTRIVAGPSVMLIEVPER